MIRISTISRAPVTRSQFAYDASKWSPNRSLLWTPLQGGNDDLDRYTLDELTRHSRNLYQNSPLIRGLIERLVTYTVGNGIFPYSASKDAGYAKRANATLKFHSRPVLNSRASWGSFCRQVARETFRDGNLYALKVENESERRRLQLIRAHNLANKDGIVKDASGKPTRYYFKNSQGKSVPYEAEQVIHFALRVYADADMGEPILASAINTARDVEDILAMEKSAVKEASSVTDVIKTASGELDREAMRKAQYGDGTADPEDRTDYYRTVFGPGPRVLKWGDEFERAAIARPGPAWQGFMDFLSQTLCLAANVPPSILLQIKVGGADTRRDLAAAARAFEILQDEFIPGLQEAAEYFLEGDGIYNMPADWNSLSWQTPKAITADAGREAQSDREDVKARLLTKREYHGRYGANYLDEEAQEDVEIRETIDRAQRLSAEKGIPFETALFLYTGSAEVMPKAATKETTQP